MIVDNMFNMWNLLGRLTKKKTEIEHSPLEFSEWTFNISVTFKEHEEHEITFISTDGEMIRSGENKYYPEVTYGFSCKVTLSAKESRDEERENIAMHRLLNDSSYKLCLKKITDKYPEREYEVKNELAPDGCKYFYENHYKRT